MLKQIETGREAEVSKLCKEMDKYEGPILLDPAEWEAAIKDVPEQTRRDIEYSHANVKAFAQKQRDSVTEFEAELTPGVVAGENAALKDLMRGLVRGLIRGHRGLIRLLKAI